MDTFAQYRPLLFGLAYRMSGSVAEAEDIVQEAYLRWQGTPAGDVKSAKAFLTTIVTRLCIDHLRSAQHQREQYVGLWLPEPLLTTEAATPEARAELADSLTTAFLLVLESLTPTERAVFLLREVFGYDYDEVSQIVGKTQTNCRQLATRAREQLAARRPRFHVDPERARKLVEQFQLACMSGDIESLMGLLTDDAALYADGGGKVPAIGKPVLGAATVAKFFVNVIRHAPPGLRFRFATINAESSALVFIADKLEQAMIFEFADNRIGAIYVIRNPEKLRHLSNFNVEEPTTSASEG